jgi:serine/threonine protein kinase
LESGVTRRGVRLTPDKPTRRNLTLPPELPPPTPDPLLPLRETLRGRYEVLRELGRGGMGIVWLAHEAALNGPLALMLLPAAAGLVVRWATAHLPPRL